MQMKAPQTESKREVESAADYPAPPVLEPTSRHLKVVFNGEVVAETRNALRLIEKAHAPNYYIPAEDVDLSHLDLTSERFICQLKGEARYYDVHVGDKRAKQAVWSFAEPSTEYAELEGYYCFYVHPMDECLVDGEPAKPEPIKYYGGWVTSDVKGPFAGERE